MNMPVEVRAFINTRGNINLESIILEDDNHMLQTYEIQHIDYTKEENLAGYRTILFVCYIIIDEIRQQIKVKFIIDTHHFVFVE